MTYKLSCEKPILIPAKIMIDSNLSKTAKLIFGVLNCYDCPYITNKQLSALVGVNQNNVKKSVKQLIDNGYIKCYLKKGDPEKPNSKPRTIRRLEVVKL